MGNIAPEENGVPAPEEAPAAPAPEAEAPPEQPQWQGPSQEEWEQAQQFQQAAGPILQQMAMNMGLVQNPQAQQQAQQAPPELDPFDPNSVSRYIDYQVDQRTSSYDNMMQLVEADQGERLARAELERLHGEVGNFDDDTALVIASGLLDQGVPPNQALQHAAGLLRAHEDKVREDERQKHGIQMQALHEAPREGPAGQGIAQETARVPTGKNRYEDVVESFLASRRPGMPIG